MTPGIDQVIVVPPNGGEVIGDAPDRRVEILSDAEPVHATWSRFGRGRDGADLHVHRRHTDLFYVLEGELTLKLGLEDERITAPAGTLIRVPPMVVHGFLNASADTEVRYLNFHAPGVQFADYLRALRDGRDFTYDQEPPPADGIRPPSGAAIGAEASSPSATACAARCSPTSTRSRSRRCAPRARPGCRTCTAGTLASFYVLEGELAVSTGERSLRAGAGTWVQVPPGVPHALSVPGEARYLEVHAPGFGAGSLDREPAP